MTRDDDLHTTRTPRVSLTDEPDVSPPAPPNRFPERSHGATVMDGRAAPAEAYCPACGASYPPDTSTCPREGARLIKLKSQGDPMLGRVLEGRYEVRAALGEGGMGTVYRGHQLSVDREVAIKVIHPAIASDRVAVKRFLREARLSSRLAQPNIVNVYDFGQTEDGVLYIVMELLRGRTLATELEAQQPMAIKRVVHVALQLCDALESAHLHGIIHRDLKPGNIIVLDDPPGRDLIKVLDFGLAKSLASENMTRVTMSNAMVGTPMYMAPEQISGKETDQRADVYALGCIMFHMLAGRAPYAGDNVNVVLAAHMNEAVPSLPSHVPPGLAQTIQRMMSKDPQRRIPSAGEVREALQVALTVAATAAPATPARNQVFESVALDTEKSLSAEEAMALLEATTKDNKKEVARNIVAMHASEASLVRPRPWPKLAAVVAVLVAIPLVVMLVLGGGSDDDAPKRSAPSAAPSTAPTKVEAPPAADTQVPAVNTATPAAPVPPVPPAPADVKPPPAPASTATAPSSRSSSSSKSDKSRSKSDRTKSDARPADPATPRAVEPKPAAPAGPSIDFYPSKKK